VVPKNAYLGAFSKIFRYKNMHISKNFNKIPEDRTMPPRHKKCKYFGENICRLQKKNGQEKYLERKI
jgi:hypothetical protein